MGNKNICALIPTWQRVSMTIETIRRIKNQTYPPTKIVIVGSEEEDMDIPTWIDVDYIQAPNNPLGKKIQKGIEYCRQFEPEALLMCGSDDWLSSNWIDSLIPFLENYDIIGSNYLYPMLFFPERGIKVAKCSYDQTDRKGEPVGPGRILSKRILDKIDWKLYPSNVDSSLDIHSFAKMKGVGAIVFTNTDDKIKVLSPKGDWSTVNNWEATVSYGELVVEPEEWLETYFPDVMRVLCRLTDMRLEVGVIAQPNKTRKKIWSDYHAVSN